MENLSFYDNHLQAYVSFDPSNRSHIEYWKEKIRKAEDTLYLYSIPKDEDGNYLLFDQTNEKMIRFVEQRYNDAIKTLSKVKNYIELFKDREPVYNIETDTYWQNGKEIE